jgi:uncharacterized protein
MPSARLQDPNGFLLVRGCPISSFGVFQYSAAQVGMKDEDPNKVVNVFRPESAVNDPELIASLQNVPLINDHEMLSGFEGDENASAPEDYGVDGVLFDVAYQPPWLRGDVKVFTRKMQSDLADGKADLSLGYTCDFLLQPGTFNGTAYDVVQTNMRGNHIALVSAGRVPGAKVLDSKKLCFDHLDLSSTSKERQMAKRKALDSDVVANLRAQLKALLPAFEQFLNEEAAEPAHSGGVDPGAATPPAGAAPAAAAPDATVAAAPAAPPAGGAAPPPPVAVAPPAAAPAAAAPPGDIGALVQQFEAILAKLKEAMAGTAPPADPGEADPGEGGDPSATAEPSGEESDSTENEGTEMPEAKKPEGDAVEGLNEDPNSQTINTDSEETTEQGTASPGPAAGKHTGADAAMRAVYADIAAKTKLYDRLSKVVGAFDGAIDVTASTASDIAAYGVKKLKLKVVKGQERVALDAYLTGVEAGRALAATKTAARATADAAQSEVPAIAAYFKE